MQMVKSISQPTRCFRRLQLLSIHRHGKGIDSGAKQVFRLGELERYFIGWKTGKWLEFGVWAI